MVKRLYPTEIFSRSKRIKMHSANNVLANITTVKLLKNYSLLPNNNFFKILTTVKLLENFTFV